MRMVSLLAGNQPAFYGFFGHQSTVSERGLPAGYCRPWQSDAVSGSRPALPQIPAAASHIVPFPSPPIDNDGQPSESLAGSAGSCQKFAVHFTPLARTAKIQNTHCERIAFVYVGSLR